MQFRMKVAVFVAVGAAVLAGGSQPRSALAIEGALQYSGNGHWYKLITSSVPLRWTDCKVNAEALGGHLATITSAGEDQWVVANIAPSGWTYIGGTDAAVEGTWTWVTGEAWSYTNWDYRNPSNDGGSEHYLHQLHEMGPGQWNDISDINGGYPIYQYIVEWSGTPGPPTPAAPPDAPSDLDATVSVGNPIRLTWTDNGANEEEFEVERRTEATGFSRVAELGPNSTVFEDTATAPDTSYTYRVRADNAAGTSGYSNEDTVTSSGIAPAPKAPALFSVIQASSNSVALRWVDTSLDEVAFEVHRRTPPGAFAIVASVPSNSWTFTDADLPPDTDFVYGVRSVNAFRASPLVEVGASTLPTLVVTPLKGALKDSLKFGKDSLKFTATYEFLAGESDGVADFVGEGFTLRAGSDSDPVVMTLPKHLDGWNVRGAKATWKSPKGSSPKYMVQVDLEARLVKAAATGLELASPAANPMRVSISVGNDGGTARGDWETKKVGVFRLR